MPDDDFSTATEIFDFWASRDDCDRCGDAVPPESTADGVGTYRCGCDPESTWTRTA